MKRTLLAAFGVMLTVGTAWVVAQETLPASATKQTAEKPTVEAQYSYAIGFNMGSRFRSDDMAIDFESLMAGYQAGLSGAKPKFDQNTCDRALMELDKRMRNKANVQAQTAGAPNRKLGEAFLAKNKTKEGVKVTKSGLQYKVIKAGTGKTPSLNDTVSCNYRGTLIDGTEFDASAKHGGPASFPVSGVIKGWTEALQLMKVGDKWQLYIPAELAYGNSPPGPPIQAGSTLVFDIELLGIK